MHSLTQDEAQALANLTNTSIVLCMDCGKTEHVSNDVIDLPPWQGDCQCGGVVHSFLPQSACNIYKGRKVFDVGYKVNDECIYAIGNTPEDALAHHFSTACRCTPCLKVMRIVSVSGKAVERLTETIKRCGRIRANDIASPMTRKLLSVVLSRFKEVSWEFLLNCPCQTNVFGSASLADENRIEAVSAVFPGVQKLDDWPLCVRCYAPLCMKKAAQLGDYAAFCHVCSSWSALPHRSFSPDTKPAKARIQQGD